MRDCAEKSWWRRVAQCGGPLGPQQAQPSYHGIPVSLANARLPGVAPWQSPLSE
jgi:hypothetical protein